MEGEGLADWGRLRTWGRGRDLEDEVVNIINFFINLIQGGRYSQICVTFSEYLNFQWNKSSSTIFMDFPTFISEILIWNLKIKSLTSTSSHSIHFKILRLEATKVSIRFTVYIHAGQNAQTRAGFQVIKLLQAHHPQINEAESQRGKILSVESILQINYSWSVT